MIYSITNTKLKRIAFIGNYLPRQCGIATFTTDLCEAIASQYSETICIALPVNDIESGYEYPQRVRYEIHEKDIETYQQAADFLNHNNVDLVCLQFEYGIFGGRAGSHILSLLRKLRMPVCTTLHTILDEPNQDQKSVMEEIAQLSSRLIVMSAKGIEFLQKVYNVQRDKIDFIPHGIPDVPFVDPSYNKDLFGVEGKHVLLSFGLLSESKGIETVISAMPKIIEKFPNTVYIVVGATHPHVIEKEGETYRLSLEWLVHQKDLERNVIFYNRFVSLEELVEFIGSADIYITPYINEAQITSGTLAYTLGAGKAIISTPYWYAREVLAEGRGILVPFKNPDAISEQVIYLLENDAERHAMRKRAYVYGRGMVWHVVAKRYMECFQRARGEKHSHKSGGIIPKVPAKYPGELPPLKLDHLKYLTDDTGVLQHSIYTIPNYSHGYTTDDNARGLLVSILLDELGSSESKKLTTRYLAFLGFAFNDRTKFFRNFMNYQRNWLEEIGSDDSQGRVFHALGTAISRSTSPAISSIAGWLFEQSLPAISLTISPRAWAFALFGLIEYSTKYSGDRQVISIRDELAERLLSLYKSNRMEGWHWYENVLSYCNAALPHALLACGRAIPNKEMTEAGLESLLWLSNLQHSDSGYFLPIGTNGFYRKGEKPARFDQQPVEAQTMVSACLEAYKITGDLNWNKEARKAFEWFLGRNDLNLSLYDPTTGGCRDGLHPDRRNENQGAESTLAFLQSLLEFRLAERALKSMEALNL